MQQFADLLSQVRSHLGQVKKMQYQYQREGWFLDAASLYCDAVHSLADGLSSAQLGSRALRAFSVVPDGLCRVQHHSRLSSLIREIGRTRLVRSAIAPAFGADEST